MANAGTTSRAPRGGKGRRGVTLIELIIAVAVLGLALILLMSIIFSSGTLQEATREKAIAYNFVRKLIEEMRSAPFDPVKTPTGNVFALYAPPVGGNANRPGTKYTYWTDATNLKNQLGLNSPVSGPQLEIIFPIRNNHLDETMTDLDLQMPKDLDWTGLADSTNVDDTFKILPVKIIVHWSGIHNLQNQVQICTFLTSNR